MRSKLHIRISPQGYQPASVQYLTIIIIIITTTTSITELLVLLGQCIISPWMTGNSVFGNNAEASCSPVIGCVSFKGTYLPALTAVNHNHIYCSYSSINWHNEDTSLYNTALDWSILNVSWKDRVTKKRSQDENWATNGIKHTKRKMCLLVIWYGWTTST